MYKPRLNLEALRALIAVNDLGGFTAAARSMNRSQSSVSEQIKKLEDLLGKTLIERTTRNLSITPTGKALIEDSRQILTLTARAEERVTGSNVSGRIRLGIPEEIASGVLPNLIADLRLEFPQLCIDAMVGLSKDLAALLDKGMLDIIVSKNIPSTPRCISTQPMVWAGLASVFDMPVIPTAFFSKPCEARKVALKRLEEMGIVAEVIMTTTSHQSLLALVEKGLAVTILPNDQCPNKLDLSARSSLILPKLPTVGYSIATSANNDSLITSFYDRLALALKGNVAIVG